MAGQGTPQVKETVSASGPVNGLPITLNAVSKDYRSRTVVSDVTLTAQPGQCLALLGPNGAGKTTLFKMLLALIQPSSGNVTIGEHPPGHPAVRAQIGFLPESVAFDRAATGEETLRYFSLLKGAERRACAGLFERVGLADAARQRIGTYSKGMRQRLALAQALIGSPSLLLLDEPTTGLDPELRRQFYAIIAKLRDDGATVIISSHALAEIEDIADTFAILREGKLVASGSLDELKRRASLPTRFRIAVPEGEATTFATGLDNRLTVTNVNGRCVELECAEGFKVDAVRAITARHPDIRDIEIKAPSLELLYQHFTAGEAKP